MLLPISAPPLPLFGTDPAPDQPNCTFGPASTLRAPSRGSHPPLTLRLCPAPSQPRPRHLDHAPPLLTDSAPTQSPPLYPGLNWLCLHRPSPSADPTSLRPRPTPSLDWAPPLAQGRAPCRAGPVPPAPVPPPPRFCLPGRRARLPSLERAAAAAGRWRSPVAVVALVAAASERARAPSAPAGETRPQGGPVPAPGPG